MIRKLIPRNHIIMKIKSENFENRNDQELLTKRRRSRFTLKFSNSSMEKDYNEIILTEIASAVGINRSESLPSFFMSYFAVVTIYLISYISSYLEGNSNQSSLMFQLILILPISLFTLLIVGLISIEVLDSKLKTKFLLFFYFITCEAIILNSLNVQSKIFLPKSNKGFQTILGILPLFCTSKFVVYNSFLMYFLGNTLICTSFLILNLTTGDNVQEIILEFLLLFSVSCIETKNFFTLEKRAREKFATIRGYLAPRKDEDRYFSPKSDIEEIFSILKDSVGMMANGINAKVMDSLSLQKVFENLTIIMRMLGSRSSVYSVDLENLHRSMDNDDKRFLQETCSRATPANSRPSIKIFMMGSVEVLDDYTQELRALLKSIGKEWNFNTFMVRDYTGDKPLATIGDFCMKRYDLNKNFCIDSATSTNFFMSIEELYKPNPYHNSAHASDVLCSYLFFVRQSSFCDFIEDIEILASLIANLGHDVGHPGFNNRFLVNSKDPLAILCKFYIDNDVSVLEMMHCSTVFKVLQLPTCNIFGNLKREDEITVRILVIEMILGTDMAKHFDFMGKFKTKLMNSDTIPMETLPQRTEIMQILIKAADIGHAAKINHLHQQWSSLVIEEFFVQGDMEKDKGLPVSMYCDRTTTDIPKSQSGFIRNIVLPFYDAVYAGLRSEKIKQVCIEQLEINLQAWELMSEKKRGMTQEFTIERKRLKEKREDFTLKSHRFG